MRSTDLIHVLTDHADSAIGEEPLDELPIVDLHAGMMYRQSGLEQDRKRSVARLEVDTSRFRPSESCARPFRIDRLFVSLE